MGPGAFCISIDLELAWGVWDRPSAETFRLCAEKERPVVAALLEAFSSREIAVTWAVVGRLLEATARPPAPSEFGERIWYAPDLVEAIRAARPGHDVGSHGFAHPCFDAWDRERLREDLRSARRVHAAHGLDFTSFVFPRNHVRHLDLLAEVGVRVFRGADAGWYTAVHRRLGVLPGRAAHLAETLLPLPPAVVAPALAPQGLVELPGSMLLMGRAGPRRAVLPRVVEAKARLGLRRAARSGRTFHLWFHPSNFYRDTAVQLGVLARILDEACALRERGEIRIRTMSTWAQAVAAPARKERGGARGGRAYPEGM